MNSLFIVLIAIIATVSAKSLLCKPDSTFADDDCIRCTCSSNGFSADCIVTECLSENDESKQVCKPESKFKEYCNSCYCNEDGQSYSCTKKTCDPAVWNRDGSRKIDLPEKQVCVPNSSFMKDCNFCFCSPDGTVIGCTFADCDGFALTDSTESSSLEN